MSETISSTQQPTAVNHLFFTTDKKPEQYDNELYHGVIRRAIWQKPAFLLNPLSIKGRAAWGAPEPFWGNGVTYYNTHRSPLECFLKRIVIHHTDNSSSILGNELRQKAIKRYAALAYHFFIDQAGMVYEGRPIEVMGAHAGEVKQRGVLNDPDWGSIGVVLQGDYEHADDWFTSSEVPQEQFKALKQLLVALKNKYRIEKLLMHHEVKRRGKPTLCPGDHLIPMLEKLRTELYMVKS